MMLIVLGIAGPSLAQQTTGNITGRLVDDQGAAVPGVTVTAKNARPASPGRTVTDAEGVYRLTALPVGTYDLTAELPGFSKVENKGIVVQRRADARHRHDAEAGERVGDRHGHRRDAADRDHARRRSAASSTSGASRACRSTAVSSRTSRRRSRASASASTPTRPRARSTRRRSTAATAAT